MGDLCFQERGLWHIASGLKEKDAGFAPDMGHAYTKRWPTIDYSQFILADVI
jgi:hypothetical protein